MYSNRGCVRSSRCTGEASSSGSVLRVLLLWGGFDEYRSHFPDNRKEQRTKLANWSSLALIRLRAIQGCFLGVFLGTHWTPPLPFLSAGSVTRGSIPECREFSGLGLCYPWQVRHSGVLLMTPLMEEAKGVSLRYDLSGKGAATVVLLHEI